MYTSGMRPVSAAQAIGTPKAREAKPWISTSNAVSAMKLRKNGRSSRSEKRSSQSRT